MKKKKSINVPIKASKMYLSGVKKGTICKKFCISKNTLDEYLMLYRYQKSIEMKFKKVPNDIICEKLKIDINLLEHYINVYYINTYPEIFITRKKRSDGKSPLLDELYWKYRISRRFKH